MESTKRFINVLANIVVGIFLGVFRKGEFFDSQTNHLSRSGYLIFITTLVIALVVLIYIFNRIS